MTEYELAEYLTTLLGYVDEGGSSELAEFDTDVAATAIERDLPRNLTADTFAQIVLGFNLHEPPVILDVEKEA